MQFSIQSKVWIYPGKATWYFITIPEEESRMIEENFHDLSRGWWSFPVEVKIGETIWKTSIFPQKKTNSFILPLKKEIRKKENIFSEKNISCTLRILF